jgi:hypothetical protein
MTMPAGVWAPGGHRVEWRTAVPETGFDGEPAEVSSPRIAPAWGLVPDWATR